MIKTVFQFGLYRHFKGGVYFAQNIITACGGENDGQELVQYTNALNPTRWFARPLSEWEDDVSERKDNVTGQTMRMEKIKSLDDLPRNLDTSALLRELSFRSDSPLQDLDLEGLSQKIVARDYCVGRHEVDPQDPNNSGVYVYSTFPTEKEAKSYRDHVSPPGHQVFRRVFVEVDD